MRPIALTLVLLATAGAVRAAEVPSFMQRSDVFCSSEADFDDYVRNGHPRANSAMQTCQSVIAPTRVAVLGGQGGTKTMVRVMSGPLSYEIGWTNGKLPLAK